MKYDQIRIEIEKHLNKAVEDSIFSNVTKPNEYKLGYCMSWLAGVLAQVDAIIEDLKEHHDTSHAIAILQEIRKVSNK